MVDFNLSIERIENQDKVNLNVTCDAPVSACEECFFQKKCNSIVLQFDTILKEIVGESYPLAEDECDELTPFNGVLLNPYEYEGRTIFYFGRFGNTVLIQAQPDIHPMDYSYQVLNAVAKITKNLDKEEILVVFDMKYYGSGNFEILLNKNTEKLRFIDGM